MRESTAEWLRPLQERADRELPRDVIGALLLQVMIPTDEGEDSDFVKWAMKNIPDAGIGMRAIDWLSFGRLLRQKLEWWDYPDSPSEDETK